MTIDELEKSYQPPKQNVTLVKVEKRESVALPVGFNALQIPRASKTQLLALDVNVCPTCGGDVGELTFDQGVYYFCYKTPHHRFFHRD